MTRGAPAALTLAFLLIGCDGEPSGPDPDELRERFGLETLGQIPYPPDNPFLAERVELGRLLFFDPILSGEQDVACGTCHHPQFNFTDGRQFAAGVSGLGLGPQRVLSTSAVTGNPIGDVPRNSPTILNTAFAHDINGVPSHLAPMFWDGRAAGLEDQAVMPVASRIEMRGDAYPGTDAEATAATLDSLVARLRGIPEYVTRFGVAFPDDPAMGADVITASTLGRAVAAYERELVTRNSPYDRFVAGDDDALTVTQRIGVELFFTQAKCSVCHRGAMFSTFQFLVTGTPQEGPGKNVIPGDDTGREEHTGQPEDRYQFRVPSLRNVELTAPYMHAGTFDTLEEVVRFYNDGAQPRHACVTDDMLEIVVRGPLGFDDDQVMAVVEFLKSLSDPGTELDQTLLTVPTSVPSGLTPVFGVAAGAAR